MTQDREYVANLAHAIAEALEENNPSGLVVGEDERRIIREVIGAAS